MAGTPTFPSPSEVQQSELDDALEDTFPASDPPGLTDPTRGIKSALTGPTEDAIRQRAYEIWKRGGSLHGSHVEHWSQARQELEADTSGRDA